jgi:hypothetical protein
LASSASMTRLTPPRLRVAWCSTSLPLWPNLSGTSSGSERKPASRRREREGVKGAGQRDYSLEQHLQAEALEQLEREGFPFDWEDLRYIWPTRFEHINVYGRYEFNFEEARR